MASTSDRQADPAPLFDVVTGFPPDDAVDVVVPMPLSLAVHMTVLESTGHAAELAVLKRIHLDRARATVRRIGIRADELLAPDARVRITHLVEQRVPRVNGLRPHIHAYVGLAGVSASRDVADVERLAGLDDSDVFPEYCDGLAAATAERVGLVWGETGWSSREVVGAAWLAERTDRARHDDLSCPGPWPRRQLVLGRSRRP